MTRFMATLTICFLTLATGCSLVRIDRVQVGPDKWPGESNTETPASQPAEMTQQERLEKLFGMYGK